MRLRFTVVLLLGLAAASGAAAQVFAGIGGGVVATERLDARLRAAGYPALPGGYFAAGVGGQGAIGRFIVGGEGYRLRGLTHAEGTASTAFRGGSYGVFTVGYVVYRAKQVRVYPLVSAGGGRVHLRLARQAAPTFEAALNASGRRTDITRSGLLLGPGVGAEYRMPTVLLVLGVRAGYLFAPAVGAWTADGIVLEEGPAFDLSGPYVRFLVGGAGASLVGQLIGSLF